MERRISRATAAAAAASKSVDKVAVDKVAVDKVAVATKHPGVFMATVELEEETGTKLKLPDERKATASDEPITSEEMTDSKEKKEKSVGKAKIEKKTEEAAEEIKEAKLEKEKDASVRKEKVEAKESSDHSEKPEEESASSLPSRPQRERKRSQGARSSEIVAETTDAAGNTAKKRKTSVTEVAVNEPSPAQPEQEDVDEKPADPIEAELARLDTIEEQAETEAPHTESSDTTEEAKAEDKAPSSPTVTRSSMNTRRSRKLQVEAEQATLEAPGPDALPASGSLGPDELSENESVSSGVREEVESVDSSGSAPMTTRAARGGKKPRDLRVRVQAKGKGKNLKGKGSALTTNSSTNIKGKGRRSIFKRSVSLVYVCHVHHRHLML